MMDNLFTIGHSQHTPEYFEDLLKKYGHELGFKGEAEYIEKEFKDYREFISEHMADVDYLNKSESTLRKHAENIDNKCDIIIWGLY